MRSQCLVLKKKSLKIYMDQLHLSYFANSKLELFHFKASANYKFGFAHFAISRLYIHLYLMLIKSNFRVCSCGINSPTTQLWRKP